MKIDLDKTLSRFSHLSQIGLLLSAIFTIWYTVIPLYGKAVLEEQIAEKTIELKKINNQVATQYSVLKKNYIKDLQTTYIFACVLNPLTEIPEYSDRLDYDLAPCFSEVKEKVLKESLLNEFDKNQFDLVQLKILNNLESIKNKNKNEFIKIENIQINEIYLLPEIEGYSKKAFEFIKKSSLELGQPYPYQEELVAKKNQAKLNLDSKYKDELIDLIKNSFKEIK